MEPSCSSGWGFISGGTEGREIELKSPNIVDNGGLRPPLCCQYTFLSLRLRCGRVSSLKLDVVVITRVQSHGDKHVNTCLYHCWAVAADRLMVVIHYYVDRQRLYECNGVKIIVLCGLQVEIINIHVFTHHPGLVHHVLHTK